MKRPKTSFQPDSWGALRRYTAARIALGRAGGSLPTAPHLAFQLAHAQARDAVHAALDAKTLVREFGALGHEVVTVASRAPDRETYLRRPDLGRRLSEASRGGLERARKAFGPARFDAAIVVADGLSALAVARNAAPLVAAVSNRLRPPAAAAAWLLSPIVIAHQGRVALGDEIGAILGTRMVAVLIGERPGLSAPDSLGVYLTFGPAIGRTDAERNCISNIRDGGLSPDAAAVTLAWLMTEAHRRQLTGVALKDETAPLPVGPEGRNFLASDTSDD